MFDLGFGVLRVGLDGLFILFWICGLRLLVIYVICLRCVLASG